MESINLLDDGSENEYDEMREQSNMWSSFTSSLFGSSKPNALTAPKASKPVARAEDDKIHVFSLATGHMYERLLRIMMLSVTKRSSMPVKVSHPHSFSNRFLL
jgi:UDP-glucose:glycoprotein glucosyltransferase